MKAIGLFETKGDRPASLGAASDTGQEDAATVPRSSSSNGDSSWYVS